MNNPKNRTSKLYKGVLHKLPDCTNREAKNVASKDITKECGGTGIFKRNYLYEEAELTRGLKLLFGDYE